MKIYIIKAMEFVIFDYFEKYFFKIGMLKECLGALINKTFFKIVINVIIPIRT